MARPSILRLNEDVLRLIIAELASESPSLVFPLAKASKFCYGLAIPALYRSITLTFNGPEIEPRVVVRKLLKHEHAVLAFNKHLTIVGSWNSFSWKQPAIKKLVKMIHNVKQLQSFR